MLKEYIHTDADGNTEHRDIKYDNYGNVTEIETGNAEKTLYSYVYGTDGRWTERITSSQNSTADAVPQTKDVRTLDGEGRVLTLDTYSYNTDASTWVPVRSLGYDYIHNDDENRVQGHCVKDFSYEESDTQKGTYIAYGNEYVWYEPMGMFLERSNTSDSKQTVDISDNGVVVCRYRATGSAENPWMLQEKIEYLINQPTAEFYTLTGWSADGEGTLSPNYRSAYTYNWDAPMINDGKHREKIDYDWVDGAWQAYRKKTLDWEELTSLNIARKAVVYYDGSYDDEVDYYCYTDEGEEIDYDAVRAFDDNGYVMAEGLGSGPDENMLYTFYNTQGQVVRKVRRRNVGLLYVIAPSASLSDGSQESSSLSGSVTVEGTAKTEYIYEEEKDGQWVPVSGKFSLPGESYYDDYRIDVTLNENGYPLEVHTYLVDGTPHESHTFTYMDNGYTESRLRYDDDLKCMVKDSYQEMSVDANGTIFDIFYKYEFDDDVDSAPSDIDYSISDAYKTFIYANGKMEKYRWNYSEKKFSDTPKYYGVSLVTTDSDGVTTNITRRWDGTKIVETEKSRSWADGQSSWTEKYKMENGEWVGESKNAQETVQRPQFEVQTPSDPLQVLDNSLVVSPSAYSMEDGDNVNNWYSYSWDADTKTWKMKEANATTFSSDDDSCTETRTETRTEIVGGNESGPIYGIVTEQNVTTDKRDSQNHLVEHSESRKDMSQTAPQHISTTAYEYDGDNLTKKTVTETDDGGQTTRVEVFQYVYCDAPTGIGRVAELAPVFSLTVKGRTLSVVPNAESSANGFNTSASRLTLYSVDGKQIAVGTDSVTAPSAGLYIVEVNGVKVKVGIK